MPTSYIVDAFHDAVGDTNFVTDNGRFYSMRHPDADAFAAELGQTFLRHPDWTCTVSPAPSATTLIANLRSRALAANDVDFTFLLDALDDIDDAIACGRIR